MENIKEKYLEDYRTDKIENVDDDIEALARKYDLSVD